MLFHVQLDGDARTVELAELEDLVREGRVGPETPVRPIARDGTPAGAWATASAFPWFEAVRAGPAMAVRRAWQSPPVPWMTALIVGICVRVYLWLPDTEAGARLFHAMSKWAPAILEKGEVWRLLTCALLHGSVMHLVMNMLFLAYVGAALETLLGWASVGTLFLVTVFGGSVLSGALSNEPSVGASGADFGYLAAAGVLGWRFHDLLPPRARPRFGTAMMVYIAWSLLSGAFDEKIDNLAHVGGVLAGLAFGALAMPRAVAAWRPRNLRLQLASLALVVVGTIASAWIPVPMEPVEADGVAALRPSSWREGFTPSGDFGWISPLEHAAVVVRTDRGAVPADAGAAADAFLAPLRAAGAVDEAPRDTRDGALHFSATAGARRVEGLVFTRGVYTHLVAASWEADNPRLAVLAHRVLDAARLEPVAAEAEVKDAGDGPLGLVARARVESDLGQVEEARALLTRARTADPGKAPVVAELQVASRWKAPDTAALAEDALARFPDDTTVIEAATDALVAAGQADRARAAVDAALGRKPDSKRLARLREKLAD